MKGTLLETVWPNLNPATARIVVVEADGEIVGCATLFEAWHLEGGWIAPMSRGSVAVGRQLARAMDQLLAALHVQEVFMSAHDVAGSKLCQGLGPATPLNCAHFAVDVRARGRS